MTQDEIYELARQAYENCDHIPDLKIPKEFVERFAKLVAAKEREACANLCIDEVWASTVQGTAVEAFNYSSRECANRIRARGEA
jgi:hypothetical protein